MATKDTITEIRRNVENCIGQEVVLKTNVGRKKVFVKEGVIEAVYPSVFIVKIDNGLVSERKVSYSYSDILTETVEMTLSESETRIQAS